MDKAASCVYGKGRCLHGFSQAKVGKDSTELKSRTDLRDLIGLCRHHRPNKPDDCLGLVDLIEEATQLQDSDEKTTPDVCLFESTCSPICVCFSVSLSGLHAFSLAKVGKGRALARAKSGKLL